MSATDHGKPIEWEFSSADASTAAVIVVREAGQRTSLTLAANEYLLIQKFSAVVTTTTAQIIADTDADGDVDAGDIMAALGTGINNCDFMATGGGISSAKGRLPRVKAAAGGQITIAGVGVIIGG